MFWVYILYSPSSDSYYIGQTQNIEDRLFYHNNGKAISTKHGIPWSLKWKHKCKTRSEAIKLESWIKSMKSREFTERIVSGEVNLENWTKAG